MFEKASRLKLRFDTTRGQISAEDLWDLPLTSSKGPSLDAVGMDLLKQARDTGEVMSLVDDTRKTDEVLQLKLEIVKHIIQVKKAENAAKDLEKVKSDKKQQLLGLLAEKENEELKGKSAEEIRALIATM